ncbi:MAG: Tyrosine-protein kinase abl1, partial [Paramarteilia canceri]
MTLGKTDDSLFPVRCARHIIEAMVYLRNLRIVHTRININNIFVGEDKLLKIHGFGKARMLLTKMILDKSGTIELTKNSPPETLLARIYLFSSDLWYACILCLQLIYPNFELFKSFSEAKSYFMEHHDFNNEQLNKIQEDIRCKAIASCLSAKANKRGTAASLLQEL